MISVILPNFKMVCALDRGKENYFSRAPLVREEEILENWVVPLYPVLGSSKNWHTLIPSALKLVEFSRFPFWFLAPQQAQHSSRSLHAQAHLPMFVRGTGWIPDHLLRGVQSGGGKGGSPVHVSCVALLFGRGEPISRNQ